MADVHAHDGEVPEKTTPQGTQEQGVEHGHDLSDVGPGTLSQWFGGMAIALAVTFLMLWGAWELWTSWVEQRDVPPSPVLGQALPPPPPRLLPNPVDDPARPYRGLPGPAEALNVHLERENKQLQPLGLWNPQTGMPELPERAAAAVIASRARGVPRLDGMPAPGRAPAPPASGPGVEYMMPSDASGGTALENRLR